MKEIEQWAAGSNQAPQIAFFFYFFFVNDILKKS